MLVFNVSPSEVVYRGKKIPPNGGSLEYRDLTFIPTRDRELETAKILAFGSLPAWWTLQKDMAAMEISKPKLGLRTLPVAATVVPVTVSSPVTVTEVAVTATKKK